MAVGALLIAASASALLLPPLSARTPPLRTHAAVVCQEPADPDIAEDTPVAAVDKEQKLALVERAGDPFRAVRVVLYVTFGIAGLAGVVTSLLQMGSDPSATGNLAVNGGVLAAGVAIFFVDQSVTAKLREQTEKELANPYLKKGLLGDDESE